MNDLALDQVDTKLAKNWKKWEGKSWEPYLEDDDSMELEDEDDTKTSAGMTEVEKKKLIAELVAEKIEENKKNITGTIQPFFFWLTSGLMDLINMGFDYEASYVAIQKYPNNTERACNAILENAESLRAEYVPYVPALPGSGLALLGDRKPNKRTAFPKPVHTPCMHIFPVLSKYTVGNTQFQTTLKYLLGNDPNPPLAFVDLRKEAHAIAPLRASTQMQYLHLSESQFSRLINPH